MSGIDLLIEEHKYVIRMLGVIRKVCLNFMDNKEINYVGNSFKERSFRRD